MEFLKRNYVIYALLMCVVLIVCLLLMEITGQNESFEKPYITSIFTFIAPFIIWFLGIRSKKKLLKGKMTLKQGVAEGFKISLVFGIISPFIFLFYYLLINPAILEHVKSTYGLTSVDTSLVIVVDMLAQFVSAVIFGTVYALIISFFLKTKKSKK